ncbi:endonuclease/exonuclease/phosphatase family protein [Primorskyibacter flagellatus]|uniref:endonuclease/exonuclease/phosphatase family protein n=1 Tax=Primorskyibacter flagellatus TaxID=1387277 RepID=UPI003A8FCC25
MSGRPLCIVSWNIRKAVGLDWRRDPARVLRVLSSMKPDIILLQEADKRLSPRHPALPLDQVARAGWTALNADPRTPSIGHHGNAILLRSDFIATRIEPVDLPGLEPRGALLARIQGSFGAVTVGGLHLGLRHADRRRQIANVIEAAERIGGRIVLGGDLNEWRRSDEAFGLPDGWRTLAPSATFHAARPTLRFDRFLIGPGNGDPVADVPHKGESLRASDHLPIRLLVDT